MINKMLKYFGFIPASTLKNYISLEDHKHRVDNMADMYNRKVKEYRDHINQLELNSLNRASRKRLGKAVERATMKNIANAAKTPPASN